MLWLCRSTTSTWWRGWTSWSSTTCTTWGTTRPPMFRLIAHWHWKLEVSNIYCHRWQTMGSARRTSTWSPDRRSTSWTGLPQAPTPPTPWWSGPRSLVTSTSLLPRWGIVSVLICWQQSLLWNLLTTIVIVARWPTVQVRVWGLWWVFSLKSTVIFFFHECPYVPLYQYWGIIFFLPLIEIFHQISQDFHAQLLHQVGLSSDPGQGVIIAARDYERQFSAHLVRSFEGMEWPIRIASIWNHLTSVKLQPPPARLGCLCCDDPALPGDPLPPLVVEQVQVRGHHAQEGWVKTVPSTRDIQRDLQETIDSVKWPIPEHFVPVLLCTIGYSSDITRVFSVLVHVTEDSKYQSRLPMWHTFLSHK